MSCIFMIFCKTKTQIVNRQSDSVVHLLAFSYFQSSFLAGFDSVDIISPIGPRGLESSV